MASRLSGDPVPPEGTEQQQQQAQTGDEEVNAAKASDLLGDISSAVQVTLADRQADPNSPLYSAQSFEDLHLSPDLLKGVYKLGFQKPSKIQEKALPLLLHDPYAAIHQRAGRRVRMDSEAHTACCRPSNMIGQSQSGTGKFCCSELDMKTCRH